MYALLHKNTFGKELLVVLRESWSMLIVARICHASGADVDTSATSICTAYTLQNNLSELYNTN
jgi:hypothetical protein